MLVRILTQLNNDEQRWQCLQTLRSKLSHYPLNWIDLQTIVDLFANVDHHRFDLLQFLYPLIRENLSKIGIDDFIDLARRVTNDNESLLFRLVELMVEKIQFDHRQSLMDLFPTKIFQEKIQQMIGDTASPSPPPIPFVVESFHPSLTLHRLPIFSSVEEISFDVCHDEAELISTRSTSTSSLSSSSADEETTPIRTRSFMIAIKNTFERLKQTSS